MNNHHIPQWTFEELYQAKVTIYLPWVSCKDEERMKQKLNENYYWYSTDLYPRSNILVE